MDTYTRKAYAKINLGLDVIGRLENGYHQVRMIMQTVGICDELTFEKRPSGIRITLEGPEGMAAGQELPLDENNLIYKAASLMLEEYGIAEGVAIRLRKNIPIAAGMAGGSTDAAATFHGINELFGLQASQESLKKLGLRVGADVPYCIMGGTALAEGIGEKLSPLPSPPGCFLAVAKPDISVSTKYVYEHLDEEGVPSHPDIDGMINALESGDLGGIVSRLGNVLERVTVKRHPVIDELKREMTEGGALGSLMSGSGPTVFGIFSSGAQAREACERIAEKQLAKQVFVTGFCEGGT